MPAHQRASLGAARRAHARLLEFAGFQSEVKPEPHETDALVATSSKDFGPDPARFRALTIFVALCGWQGAAFATFSAIPLPHTQQFFTGQEVTPFTVNLLLNWGLIVFVPSLVPAMWLHSQRPKGLVQALQVSAILNAAGAVLRCVNLVFFAHVGQILIGASAPFVWNACASFSGMWFPPAERTTATAIGNAASFVGPAFQFLLVLPVKSVEGVKLLLWGEAIACVLCAMAVFMLLPDKPVRPPSASAAAMESNRAGTLDDPCASLKQFAADLSLIAARPACWLVAVGVGFPSGLFVVYSYSFSILFDPTDDDPFEIWLGFASTSTFVVGMLGVAGITDTLFARRLKLLAILCCAFCIAGMVVFTLALPSPSFAAGLTKFQSIPMISMIVASVTMGALLTVGVELLAELAYPAEESAVVGMMTSINMACGIGYLLVMDQIPQVWANIPILGSIVLGLVLMLFVVESYLRRDLDEEAMAGPKMDVQVPGKAS